MLAYLKRPPKRGSIHLTEATTKRSIAAYKGLAKSKQIKNTKRLKGGKQDKANQAAAAQIKVTKDSPLNQPGNKALNPT